MAQANANHRVVIYNRGSLARDAGDRSSAISWAQCNGLLPTTKTCRTHRTPMKLMTAGTTNGLGMFRCNKEPREKKSLASGTWFEETHINLPVAIRYVLICNLIHHMSIITSLLSSLMYSYAIDASYEDATAEAAIPYAAERLSSETVCNWYGLLILSHS